MSRAEEALRHIMRSCDTLSPQEIVNTCLVGLGEPWREYKGEVNPNWSPFDYRRRIAEMDAALVKERDAAEYVDVEREAFCIALDDENQELRRLVSDWMAHPLGPCSPEDAPTIVEFVRPLVERSRAALNRVEHEE